MTDVASEVMSIGTAGSSNPESVGFQSAIDAIAAAIARALHRPHPRVISAVLAIAGINNLSEQQRILSSLPMVPAADLAAQVEVVYRRLGFTVPVDLTLVGGTFKAGEIITGWLRKDLAELVRDEGFSEPKLPPVGGSLWLAARAAGLEQLLSYEKIAAKLGAALAVTPEGPGNDRGPTALPVSPSPGSLSGRTALCSRETRRAGRLSDR